MTKKCSEGLDLNFSMYWSTKKIFFKIGAPLVQKCSALPEYSHFPYNTNKSFNNHDTHDTLQNDWTFWFAWATRISILLFFMFQKSKKCSQSAKACQKQLLLGWLLLYPKFTTISVQLSFYEVWNFIMIIFVTFASLLGWDMISI